MKTTERMLLVGVTAAAVTLAATMTLRGQGASAPPVSVGTVNVETVFGNLDERNAIEADIQSRVSELQQWEQEQRKEISAMRSNLEIMQPDSPNYQRQREELEKKLINLRVELEVRQRQIEQHKALQMEQLYRKIIDGTEQVARQAGYEVVLMKDETPNFTGANQQQMAALIQVRKLLYADADLDLTDRVTQQLNNNYAASQGG